MNGTAVYSLHLLSLVGVLQQGTFQALAPLPDLGGVGLHYFEAEILEGAEGIAVGFAPIGCEGFDRLPGKHTNSCAVASITSIVSSINVSNTDRSQLHNGIGIVCGRRVVDETPLLVPGDGIPFSICMKHFSLGAALFQCWVVATTASSSSSPSMARR